MRSPKLYPKISARFISAAGAESRGLSETGICGLSATLRHGTSSGSLIYRSPEFGQCRQELKIGGVLALQIHGTCFGTLQAASLAPAALFSTVASPPLRSSSSSEQKGRKLPSGPSLDDFVKGQPSTSQDFQSDAVQVPYLEGISFQSLHTGRIYFETYGCQMNVNDMEIVLSIMKKAGYSQIVEKPDDADVIFINTCAIRENAEHKVWHRLNYFKHLKNNWNHNAIASSLQSAGPPKVAVLGCMAERLKERLLEANKLVDVVCGPDAYRDLPRLLAAVDHGQTAVNTLLSFEETYADVTPVRISKCLVSAFVSIMRGCNNMCSYCIVPFTRGRERSRPVESIVREVGKLREQGVKEVMLLGQNVNSYNDLSGSYMVACDDNGISENDGLKIAGQVRSWNLSPGFSSICQSKEDGLRFSHLLDCLSASFPEMRFRFTSPHPKDFPDELLFLMSDRPNICKSIHLPAQSGSTRILEKMRRGYTREAYLSLVERIRTILPDSSLSSDFIAGFCGETEDDHTETLSLIETVSYDMAYMFAYSLRERTHAHRNYNDDVPHSVKQRRLSELIATFRRATAQRYLSQLSSTQLVLVLGPNKRNPKELMGTSDKGHKVIFPKVPLPYVGSNLPLSVEKCKLVAPAASEGARNLCNADKETSSFGVDVDGKTGADVISNGYTLPKLGDYVEVLITETSLASLRGKPLVCTDISSFFKKRQNTNHGVN